MGTLLFATILWRNQEITMSRLLARHIVDVIKVDGTVLEKERATVELPYIVFYGLKFQVNQGDRIVHHLPFDQTEEFSVTGVNYLPSPVRGGERQVASVVSA